MNPNIIAILFQEGGKFVSQLIRNRPTKTTAVEYPLVTLELSETEETVKGSKATSIEGIACLPCVNTHFATCSGLVSDEAIRMARRHGIGEEEISRINACVDQLAAMERVDLAVDKIKELSDWERGIAIYAQNQGATIRHKLENLGSVDDLEEVAAQIKEARNKIGKDYFKGRLAHMSKGEQKELVEKAGEKAINKLLEE